jgi:hypothetical protein
LGTVKKRIRMCGRPAVPNISAMPKLIAEIGSLMKPPGAHDREALCSSFCGCLAGRRGDAVFTSTAFANMASVLKPKLYSTMKAMNDAPANSRQALMICTQVVAVIPRTARRPSSARRR